MMTNRTRVRHDGNIATDTYVAAFVLCRNHDRYASAGRPSNWYSVQPSSSKLQCKDDIIEDISEESLPSEAEETDVDISSHFSQEDTTTKYKFINTYKHKINIDLISINNAVMT